MPLAKISPVLALAALGACQEAPSSPTWADVAPIMTAHCVRCHGAPAIGGAPPTFRLDRYDDTTSNGHKILGAAAMAEWIVERTSDGSMPPRIPLSSYERELLAAWYAARPAYSGAGPLPTPPRTDGVPRGAPPRLVVTLPASAVGGRTEVPYLLTDPDDDLVVGEVFADSGTASTSLGEVTSGRGAIVVDPASLPAGAYTMSARLADFTSQSSVAIGSFVVEARSPAPPSVQLAPGTALALEDGSYVSTAELPLAVTFLPADADSRDVSLNVTLVDDRDPQRVVARATAVVLPGLTTSVALGSPTVAPGPTYRVVVEVSDGTSVARASSGRFRIAAATTTTDTFASISDAVLGPHCYGCHASFPRVPGLGLDFTRYASTATAPGVFELRRRIYQRAVVAQTMPPGSARRKGNTLSPEARARLEAWLFAGAPER